MEKSSELIQLGKVLETGHEVRGLLLSWRGVVLGNSVEEVVDCPVSVAIGCPEGGNALIPGEAHGGQLSDLRLGGFGAGLVAALLLFLGLGLLLLLDGGRLWFWLLFNFGLGDGFLARRGDTET